MSDPRKVIFDLYLEQAKTKPKRQEFCPVLLDWSGGLKDYDADGQRKREAGIAR